MDDPSAAGQPAPLPRRTQINVPDDVEAGNYADFVSVWHNRDVFVLDFGVLTQPPVTVEDENGQPFLAVPTRVVSRVRIPPSQVFEIMRALEQQLTAWEQETDSR
jgi:Protein of unknown function (DUF3467)